MPTDVLMPPLSQTMDSLTLVSWEKKTGDPVIKGEILFLAETDKATLEVESPATGIVGEILVEAGSEVAVRAKIGVIYSQEEYHQPQLLPGQAVSPVSRNLQGEIEAGTGMTASPLAPSQPIESPSRLFASPRARRLAKLKNLELSRIPAHGPRHMIVERDVLAYLEQQKSVPKLTPVARRMAEESGLDLAQLAGEKTSERIRRADVEQALAKSAPPASGASEAPQNAAQEVQTLPLPGGRRVAVTSLRKTIARRMLAGHQSTAPVTLTCQVDATELTHLRELVLQELTSEDVRPTYTDFLACIASRCLVRHPSLNGLFDGEALVLYDDVHLSLAVDTERGLLAPVIRSAQRKGITELARERSTLVRRALDGKSTPEELMGGTFSLTNLGPFGIDAFTPILNIPQIAILGVGRIHPAAAVFNGQLAAREMISLSLTFDHRAVDGGPAARLLQDIARHIERPHLIWM